MNSITDAFCNVIICGNCAYCHRSSNVMALQNIEVAVFSEIDASFRVSIECLEKFWKFSCDETGIDCIIFIIKYYYYCYYYYPYYYFLIIIIIIIIVIIMFIVIFVIVNFYRRFRTGSQLRGRWEVYR